MATLRVIDGKVFARLSDGRMVPYPYPLWYRVEWRVRRFIRRLLK